MVFIHNFLQLVGPEYKRCYLVQVYEADTCFTTLAVTVGILDMNGYILALKEYLTEFE